MNSRVDDPGTDVAFQDSVMHRARQPGDMFLHYPRRSPAKVVRRDSLVGLVGLVGPVGLVGGGLGNDNIARGRHTLFRRPLKTDQPDFLHRHATITPVILNYECSHFTRVGAALCPALCPGSLTPVL